MFGDSSAGAAAREAETTFWPVFRDRVVNLLNALHDKHTARPITTDAAWYVIIVAESLMQRQRQRL